MAYRHGTARPKRDLPYSRPAPGGVALAWGVAGLIVVAVGLFLDGQASQRELLRTLAVAPLPVAPSIGGAVPIGALPASRSTLAHAPPT